MKKFRLKKLITQLLIFAFVVQSVSPSLKGITAFAASTDEDIIVIESDESQVEVVEGEDTLYDEVFDVEADQLARAREDESFKVDDSDKLSRTENLTLEDEEIPADQELFDKTEYTSSVSYQIGNNGELTNGSLYDAISAAISQKKPIWIQDNVEVYQPLPIPGSATVEIHTNGHNITGDSSKLGSNELFVVGNKATFRLIGNKNVNYDLHKNCISGGGNGAIIVGSEATIVLDSVVIGDNTSGQNGGGLYLGSKVNCRLSNVIFCNNYAGNSGGALYIKGSGCNIHVDANTLFNKNRAGGHGGAIYVDGDSVNFYGPSTGKVRLLQNYAKGNGGAIYGNKKYLSITSFDMRNNSSDGWGGAVYFGAEGDGLTNCILTSNTSGKDGGGIYVNGTADYISDVQVKKNTCGYNYYGGGIYVDCRFNLGTSGKIIITDNHFGKDDSAPSDLFLQEGEKSTAHLKAALYSPGSLIGIGVSKWEEGKVFSFAPGNYNPKQFYANYRIRGNTGGEYYVARDSRRNLILTRKKDIALDADEVKLDRATWKTTTEAVAGRKYVSSEGEEYNLVYGYISSPSFINIEKDNVNKYFYSDGYFMENPDIYNDHLATLSMNFAMASGESNVGGHEDYLYKFDNIKSAMLGIGCAEEDIYISPSYIFKPTTGSIGVAIGQKTLKKAGGDDTGYVLVPIAIRGAGYEKEWASNVTLNGDNTSSGHETSGFRDAATQVMNAVDDYIVKYGLSEKAKEGKLKFWITGFSRGSAAANLVSKRLVDKYGSLSKEYKNNPNQIFSYCYAVPAGGTDADDLSIQNGGDGSAYYCIHNIINKADLTPLVAPKEMGFKRYGVDHYVPGGSAESVRVNNDKATEKNGSLPITTFYDNTAYPTNTSSYSSLKPGMVRQLMYVNEDIFFVDYFKEADINVGVEKALEQYFKSFYAEAQYITIDEVSDSTLILEDWLPEFYKTLQEYDTLGKTKTITRDNYSTLVVKGGKDKGDKYASGEIRWAEMGATVQDTLRGLVEMMLSKTPAETADLSASFYGIKNKMGIWQMYNLFGDLINNSEGWDKSEDIQQKYIEMFWGWLADGRYGQKSINTAITDPAERAQFQKYFPSLLGIAMRVVRQDYKNNGDKMRLLGTFAYNTETILQGHVPEIYLSWLRVNDDYYANEKNAYVWEGGQSAPELKKVIATVDGTEVGSDETHVFASDKVLKLNAVVSGNEKAAIYYTVKVNDSGESITRLYNNKQGIRLSAPLVNGSNDYTVKVWTYNSYSSAADKVEWKRLPDKGSEYTYKFKINSNTAEVKVCYSIYDPELDTYTEKTLKTTKTYNIGDKVILEAGKIFDAEILNSNALTGWKWNDADLDTKSPEVFVKDNIQESGEALLILTSQIDTINISENYLNEGIKPVAGQRLVRKINPEKLTLAAGQRKITKGYTSRISWLDSEGKPVFAPKAEAGKSYKAMITVALQSDKWNFADSVEAYAVKSETEKTEITGVTGDNSIIRTFIYDFGLSAKAAPKADADADEIIDEDQPDIVDEETESGNSEEVTPDKAGENKVTIKLVDINSNAELLSEDAGTEAAGETIYVDYEMLTYDDAFDGYDLVSWKVNDIAVTKDENDPYFLEYTMPDADVVVTAFAATSVDAIDLDVYPPETGGPIIDNPLYLMMKIGGKEYELDPESAKVTYMLKGTPCEEAVAKANTEYSALVTIKASDLKLESEDESEAKALGLKFFGDSDDIETKDITGFKKEGEASGITLWIKNDVETGLVDTINIYGSFDKTDPAYFLGVVTPEGLAFDWNEADKDNRYILIRNSLPERISVSVEDDSVDSLPVTWNEEFTDVYGNVVTADDLNGSEDDWSLIFYGKVKVPEGMEYDVPDENEEDGYKTVVSKGTEADAVTFEYWVVLEGAPFTANPSITPTSGIYDPDDGGILVEIDPGLDSEEDDNSEEGINEEDVAGDTDVSETEDIEIYYLVTPLELKQDESGNSYPVQKYTQAGFDDGGKVVFISSEGYDEAVKYVGDDTDFDKRIIEPDDENYQDGAFVYAVAVKNGSRISPMSSEVYVFMEAEVEPEDIENEFEDWTLPIGGKLGDLTGKLPAGCNWHPDVKTEEIVTGNIGDVITAKVVYNPDPEQYENKVFEISIELVSGTYDIYVEGGKAYVFNSSTEEKKPLEELKATAGTLLIFEADAPKEDEEFKGWIVFDDQEEEVPFEIDGAEIEGKYVSNPAIIGVVMPAGTIFAKAVYTKKDVPTDIETLTFGEDDEITMDVGETRSVRATAYKDGKETADKVTYTTTDTDFIEITEDTKTNSVSIKTKATGKAVVWAHCGDKATNCTITINRADVSIDVYGGAAYDTTGSLITKPSLPYGTTVVIKANKPRNEANVFDKWEVLEGTVPETVDLKKSEITFRLEDYVAVQSTYTTTEGYEDKSDYAEKNKTVKVKKLTVKDSNNKSITKAAIKLDGRAMLNAEATYASSDKPDIVFLTDNSDVVKVRTDKTAEGKATGVIIGNQPGTATVTAVCGNKKVAIKVTVEGETVEGIIPISDRLEYLENNEFGDYKLELNAGEQEYIDIVLDELNANNELKLIWKSDDPKVATVKNGLVTAKFNDKGNTTITVTPKVKPIGAKKFTTLKPVKIAVSVKNGDVPKKSRNDKDYNITMKASLKLDINATASADVTATINKYEAARNKTFTWKSTNEDVVTVTGNGDITPANGTKGAIKANIKATGIGTAYILLEGKDPADETKVNLAVMKVVVKATAPELSFIMAINGNIEEPKDATSNYKLTMKKGSCDRLLYTAESKNVEQYNYNTTEKFTLTGTGGVTVKNGLIVASKVTKPGKPAKVTLKCGKSKIVLEVTVTEK